MSGLALVLPLILSSVMALAADEDVIKQRKSLLKGFGDKTRPLALMLKGRQAFDAQLVHDALGAYVAGSKTLPGLFPDNSKTGGETEARPAIWDEKAKFSAMFEKFGAESSAASAAIVDEASFRTTMPKLLGDCKACHDVYREKK